jgi:hypothetical protein
MPSTPPSDPIETRGLHPLHTILRRRGVPTSRHERHTPPQPSSGGGMTSGMPVDDSPINCWALTLSTAPFVTGHGVTDSARQVREPSRREAKLLKMAEAVEQGG